MKALVMCAMVAAMSAAAGVQAQDSKAAPKSREKGDLDTVEVYGSNKKLGRQVQAFVSNLTRLDGELVSSWNTPVCPKVVADEPAHAEYLRARLLEIGAEVPLATNPDEKCRANLFVVLTNAPDEFIAGWKERDPGMFMWRPRRGVSRSTESLPVRTWHNVSVEPAGDAPAITAPGAIPGVETGSSGSGNVPTTKSAGGGSRIVSVVSENLHSVLVLVDTNQAAGVTLRQLADYIAMVSYSKVDLDADFSRANSILRLFAGNKSTVRPEGLTTWDRAFLRGLYRQSFEAKHQRMAITSRMMRDLVENAPREEAKP